MSTRRSLAVVLANYKTTRQLNAALRSILSQSFGRVDIVVVGYSHEVRESALLYRRFIESIDVLVDLAGEMSPREWALLVTAAEYIAYLEPGDAWYPDHLEMGIAALDQDHELMLTVAKQDVVRADARLGALQPGRGSPLPANGDVVRRARTGRDLACGTGQFPIASVSSIVARTFELTSFAVAHGSLLDAAPTFAEGLQRWRVASRQCGIAWIDSVTSSACAPGASSSARYALVRQGANRGEQPGKQTEFDVSGSGFAMLQERARIGSMIELRRTQDPSPPDENETAIDECEGADQESPGFLESVSLLYAPMGVGLVMGVHLFITLLVEGDGLFMAALGFAFGGSAWLLVTSCLGLAGYKTLLLLARGVPWVLQSLQRP